MNISDQNARSLAIKLPAGDVGTDCTIMAMRAMAEHASQRERVRTLAEQLNNPHVLYAWLRDSRRFERDPRGLEHVRHPELLLERIGAAAGERIGMDCDDVATLAVAVLMAMPTLKRTRPAFVVLAKQPPPANFAHVFYATLIENRPSMPGYKFPDNYKPPGFTPYDPQEAARIPMGQMHDGPRFRVYPV